MKGRNLKTSVKRKGRSKEDSRKAKCFLIEFEKRLQKFFFSSWKTFEKEDIANGNSERTLKTTTKEDDELRKILD